MKRDLQVIFSTLPPRWDTVLYPPRYCLPMGPRWGSESILIYDSRILLGSVSVTSGGKVNSGPIQTPLLFSHFFLSHSLLSISVYYTSAHVSGDAGHHGLAAGCACGGAAGGGRGRARGRRRCPAERFRTEGYRCVAEEETTESHPTDSRGADSGSLLISFNSNLKNKKIQIQIKLQCLMFLHVLL